MYRELRHLTQLRDTFVSEMVGMKQRIKSLLLFEGIEFPPAPAGRQWSFLVKDKLSKLECSKTVRFKLDQLLDSLEFSEKQVLKTTKEIRRFCRNDAELSQCIEYLMTIPIGWIVASQLVARIGDWQSLKISSTGRISRPRAYRELYRRENRSGAITHTGTGGFEVSSSKPPGRRSVKMGSQRFLPSVCRTHARHLASRVAIVRWRANSVCASR